MVYCHAVAMLKVLQIVEVLLQQNRHATKRDVYYNDTALLKGQMVIYSFYLYSALMPIRSSTHMNR